MKFLEDLKQAWDDLEPWQRITAVIVASLVLLIFVPWWAVVAIVGLGFFLNQSDED